MSDILFGDAWRDCQVIVGEWPDEWAGADCERLYKWYSRRLAMLKQWHEKDFSLVVRENDDIYGKLERLTQAAAVKDQQRRDRDDKIRRLSEENKVLKMMRGEEVYG